EDDLPLGLADPLDDLVLRVLRILAQHGRERLRDFPNRLMEFIFSRISALDVLDDLLDSCLGLSHVPWPRCSSWKAGIVMGRERRRETRLLGRRVVHERFGIGVGAAFVM